MCQAASASAGCLFDALSFEGLPAEWENEQTRAKKGGDNMQRDPVNSANDAKTYAQSGNIQQAIVSLADAVQGIAEYQRYIRNDQLKIKCALNIS